MLFQAGRVLVELDRVEEAFEMINRSIDHDSTNLVRYNHVDRDSSNSSLWKHAQWPEFMARLEKKACGTNIDLFRRLRTICKNDQLDRK
jgi:hypothetical protein